MREIQEYVTTLTLDEEDIEAFDNVQLILDGIEDSATRGTIIVNTDEFGWTIRETLEDLMKSCKNVLGLI